MEVFNKKKIGDAITKAMKETSGGVDIELVEIIMNTLESNYQNLGEDPTVEDIQDNVEYLLMDSDRKDVAKRYILYREERNQLRNKITPTHHKFLTDKFLNPYKNQPDPFPSELGKFVYYRTYSRPIPEENRRERWWETVARVVDFNMGLQLTSMKKQGIVISDVLIDDMREEAVKIYDMMYNLKLFPSGRTLWVGGTPSSHLYPLSNFNCSFLTIDDLSKFSEIFFVLMLGTGVGLSVEKKYVSQLPKMNSSIEVIHKDYQPVSKEKRSEHTELIIKKPNMIELIIGDSKFGWSKGMDMFLNILSSKQYKDIEFILINYDNVRPMGERLKTFGGFASGHIAIKNMFEKIFQLFQGKRAKNNIQWQVVKPIDCLDIATIIAENVVSGGTRRSAEIVFCDPDEIEVIEAKQNLYFQDENGNWTSNDKLLHRMLSNNTIFYEEKPTREQLANQFKMIKTSGEPAFGNMAEMKRRREDVQGGNPCFEILLRDRGVCNLTEVNMMGFVEENGKFDQDGLFEAQRFSARMGYRMATIELELHEWDLVNKEDMLVGCSLTGVMDFRNATNMDRDDFNSLLEDLRFVANNEVELLSKQLKLNESKLVTCIKPSGTISQLPTVSSGMHFSHSPYYIRRVRVSASDPLALAMDNEGFTWHPEVGQTLESHKTKVFEFPVKSPQGKTKYDIGAIAQLELYKDIMENYVDHNASNTVHVREHEWADVEQWVYDNWDSVVGITFLSLDDSFYQLLPYEAITEEEYDELMSKTPKFDPDSLGQFENFDEEFEIDDSECEGGACPIR